MLCRCCNFIVVGALVCAGGVGGAVSIGAGDSVCAGVGGAVCIGVGGAAYVGVGIHSVLWG